MQLTSSSFANGAPIPGEFAFAVPHPQQHVQLSENRNPELSWSDVPAGTRSFAVVCVDPDVPSRGDDVNQEGRTVPASLPRVDFFHWTLFDLGPDTRHISAGSFSNGVTPKGKGGPDAPHGCRHGVNNYTEWFAGDSDMAGDYFGYDGPCPPWNDEVVHRYVFTVYALAVDCLPLQGRLTGPEVLAEIARHSLGSASLTGTYTLNPALR